MSHLFFHHSTYNLYSWSNRFIQPPMTWDDFVNVWNPDEEAMFDAKHINDSNLKPLRSDISTHSNPSFTSFVRVRGWIFYDCVWMTSSGPNRNGHFFAQALPNFWIKTLAYWLLVTYECRVMILKLRKLLKYLIICEDK